DTDSATRPPNASFKDIAYAQLAPNLPRVDRFVPVRERGISRDDKHTRYPRQIGRHIFGDAIGKVTLFGVVAEVCEGQHDYRKTRCFGRRRDRRGKRRAQGIRRPQRDWHSEEIATPWHGLDHAPAMIAEGPAHFAHAMRKCAILDKDAGPDGLHQLVFGYQASWVLQQVAQNIEAFGS